MHGERHTSYGRPRASIEFCCCATAGISLSAHAASWIDQSNQQEEKHHSGNTGSIDVCGSAALEARQARPARCVLRNTRFSGAAPVSAMQPDRFYAARSEIFPIGDREPSLGFIDLLYTLYKWLYWVYKN